MTRNKLGLIFLAISPFWIFMMILGVPDKASSWYMVLIFAPIIISTILFTSARFSRIEVQTLPNSKGLEKAGKIVKGICFGIGTIMALDLLTSLVIFRENIFIDPRNYLIMLFSLCFFGYSYKK